MENFLISKKLHSEQILWIFSCNKSIPVRWVQAEITVHTL